MATNLLKRLTTSYRPFLKQYRRYRTTGCISPKTRRFCVTGNWKMFGNAKKLKEICSVLSRAHFDETVDVIIACPSIYFDLIRSCFQGQRNLNIASQNVHQCDKGAYTGEISVAMIQDCAIDWVLLGHSERRIIFNESDELIAEKCRKALDAGLSVVVCCGESLEERENRKSEEVVSRQLMAISKGIGKNWKNVILAYEPLWAMGTGKSATEDELHEIMYFIRNWLSKKVSRNVSNQTRIQYGGPVTISNCEKLLQVHDIDGFLVGKPSMTSEFIEIVNCKKSI